MDTMAESKQVAMVVPLQLQEVRRSSQGITNCFLPDEVMKALKPVQQIQRSKSTIKEDTSVAVASRPPASLWYYPKQRKRFQHLLADTICSCGAGKDISFLYDAASLKPITRADPLSTDLAIRDKSDPSAIRKDALDKKKKSREKLPAVVSAEEMQLVQNLGVVSLDVHQQGPAGLSVSEHTRHPALLPSMGPTSREQAKLLRATLENLLSKIGYGEEGEHPTQMHHLLELIKQEQDVYNTVFHELIRQVTVDCFERGELLSALREKYNGLINRIPKQILSLHHELVAQRALDRRLVEELARFQATIMLLTKDLERARSHDKLVSDQAKQMEKELRVALRQSERTDELVGQFRQLYELQRSRLENRVILLVEERDNWVNMAYVMAAKVIDANGLAAARNALQTERSWNTMAIHFAAILSDKDADCLLKITNFIQKVQTECNFLAAMAASESELVRNKLTTIRSSMMRIVTRQIVPAPITGLPNAVSDSKKQSRENKDKDPLNPTSPMDLDVFMDRARRWTQVVSELSELMSGDALLVKRQRVDACKKNFIECRENALILYRFHKAADGNDLSTRALLSKITRELPIWLEAVFVRMSGDAGLGAALARFARELDLWVTSAHAQGIFDTSRVPATINTWIRRTIECLDLFEASLKVETLKLGDVLRDMDKWLTDLNGEIGGDNAVISDRSRELHQTWLQWLAQALARLVPDNPSITADQLDRSQKFMLPLDNVMRAAVNLGRGVDAYTELVTICLRDRVMDSEEDTMALTQLKADAHTWLGATWELIAQILPADQPPIAYRWAASVLPLQRLRAAINTRAWEEIPESDQLYYAAAVQQHTEEELEQLDEEEESDEEAAALMTFGGPTSGKASSRAKSQASRMSQQAQIDREKTQEERIAGEAPPEDAQSTDQVTWVNNEGALHTYPPSEPPESRQHLSTLTPGLDAFLPDTQRAASAIPIVETLQDQLQTSEERCRELEFRARRAEHSLGDLEDKLRLLQAGPPLPEGQEWRLTDDPAFAAIWEKIQANEVATLNIPAAAATTGPATPHTPHGGAGTSRSQAAKGGKPTHTATTKPGAQAAIKKKK